MKSIFTFLFMVMVCFQLKAQLFVNHDAAGANDGSSWTNAFTDLQDALDVSTPGDQISIAAGVYVPSGATPETSHFEALTRVEIYGGFSGIETQLAQRRPIEIVIFSGISFDKTLYAATPLTRLFTNFIRCAAGAGR